MTLKKTVSRWWRWWWYTFLWMMLLLIASMWKLSDTVPSPPFHFDTHKLPIPTTTMTTERRHPIGCQHGQTCDCHCWRSHCPWWIAWFHEAFGMWYWNRWCLPLFHHWQPCQGEELNNEMRDHVARRERQGGCMFYLNKYDVWFILYHHIHLLIIFINLWYCTLMMMSSTLCFTMLDAIEAAPSDAMVMVTCCYVGGSGSYVRTTIRISRFFSCWTKKIWIFWIQIQIHVCPSRR